MHTLTRVIESAVRPERGINSQSFCIVRQRNRIAEIVERISTMGIRTKIRVHEAEEGNGSARRRGGGKWQRQALGT